MLYLKRVGNYSIPGSAQAAVVVVVVVLLVVVEFF